MAGTPRMDAMVLEVTFDPTTGVSKLKGFEKQVESTAKNTSGSFNNISKTVKDLAATFGVAFGATSIIRLLKNSVLAYAESTGAADKLSAALSRLSESAGRLAVGGDSGLLKFIDTINFLAEKIGKAADAYERFIKATNTVPGGGSVVMRSISEAYGLTEPPLPGPTAPPPTVTGAFGLSLEGKDLFGADQAAALIKVKETKAAVQELKDALADPFGGAGWENWEQFGNELENWYATITGEATGYGEDAGSDALGLPGGGGGLLDVLNQFPMTFNAASEAILGGADALLAHADATTFARDATMQFVQALGMEAGAHIAALITGEQSARGLTRAVLSSLAAQAFGYSLFELAAGIAASSGPWGLAIFGDPTAHFRAAAVFGSIGAIAAVGARIAPGGSSSPGSGGAFGGGSTGAKYSDRGGAVAPASGPTTPVQQVTIIVQGSVISESELAYVIDGALRRSQGRLGRL